LKKVYLAGPITGLNYEQSVGWRNLAKEDLKEFGIDGFSPMRGKEFLEKYNILSGEKNIYAFDPLSSDRGIMTRDRLDATTCDLMLVHLLGAKKVSIGTVMEIAWADLYRIPIVCVIEKEGNPHDHPMTRQALGFRVETLEEGLHITKTILLP
jgi:nucleoside 2-deoxyribosyltransferase